MSATTLRRGTAGAGAAVAVALTLLGCGSAHQDPRTSAPPAAPHPAHQVGEGAAGPTASSTRTTIAPKAPATPTKKAPASAPPPVHSEESEKHFLHAFGTAYVRYLSGGPVPAGLSAQARRRMGPRLPPHTAPRLKDVQLGGRGSASIALTTKTGHSFTVPITVRLRGAHWSVTAITPPDLDQVATPAPPPPVKAPPAARAPEAAARAFLAGYLPVMNGRGSVAQLRHLTPQLRKQLLTHPTAIPGDGTLHLAHLGMAGSAPHWIAEPLITNGQTTFELLLPLAHPTVKPCTDHNCHQVRQWAVSAIRSPE